MQHSVFNTKNAHLIGSPDVARLLLSKSRRLHEAETRATCPDALRAIHFSRPAFVNHAPVDPVRHPADLCQTVRVFRSTERQLAVLAAAFGFTFWGEAAALVLGHVAAFPDEFEVRHLKERAPLGLRKGKAAPRPAGKTYIPPAVRGIQVPLTPATRDFLAAVAARQGLSRVGAASLVLHRHLAAVAALVLGGAQ